MGLYVGKMEGLEYTEKSENVSSAEELLEDLVRTAEVEAAHAETAEAAERVEIEVAVVARVAAAATATSTAAATSVTFEALFAVAVVDLSLVT